MILSPLTHSDNITLLKVIETNDLIQQWKDQMDIDISEEVKDIEKIFFYRCNETNLRFFTPNNVAGSSKLYEKLEKNDWYYMPQKWEYDKAIEDLKECQNVLEVGCGQGAFVQRLSNELGKKAEGIELNPSAVNYARSKGIAVLHRDLFEFAQENKEKYDAVCSFQVLEHVAQPKEFLSSLLELVKPNGKLIIGVPNGDSFVKFSDAVLNQPPHHMTWWYKETFSQLSSIFPITVENHQFEPLAGYMLDFYTSVQVSRIPKNLFLSYVGTRIAYRILLPIFRRSVGLRNLIVGHTLYVCMRKKT